MTAAAIIFPPQEAGLSQPRQGRYMLTHFIDGLVSGQFVPLSKLQIQELIEKDFFSFKPLVPLTDQEESLLREYAIDKLGHNLNREIFKKLCGETFFDGEILYLDAQEKSTSAKGNIRLLSPEEKLSFFFNSNWARYRYCDNLWESSLLLQGNRNLFDRYEAGGYFENAAELRNLLYQIRESSKVKKLRVLDIGCGIGMALQDMKEIDANLETHGITMEQEPWMFYADFFHYNLAERMPTTFRSQFHLIVSNMAFRYFLFAHLALRNVVLALAKGGYAQLHFSFERMSDADYARRYFKEKVSSAEDNYGAMKYLVGLEIEKLLKLQKTGKIIFRVNPRFFEHKYGTVVIEKINEFDEEEFHG